MTRLEREQARDEHVRAAEIKLSRLYTDREALFDEVRAGLSFGRLDPNADSKIELLRSLNLISAGTFEALMGGGQPFTPLFIADLWDRLVAARIFVRTWRQEAGMFADHQIDVLLLLEHLRGWTFANLFHPPSALHSRYASAVVAIDVETASGSQSRGSGFLLAEPNGSGQWLVTCGHNVDPEAGITVLEVTTGSGQVLELGQPYMADGLDVAIYRPRLEQGNPPFALRTEVAVFDEVYTLGYPQIPGAHPVLLGHRGEVNGVADIYLDACRLLVISNLVSPGSSGCPVLDRDGRCVGMTVRWIEAEWEGQRARFSTALPGDAIQEVLSAAKRHFAQASVPAAR